VNDQAEPASCEGDCNPYTAPCGARFCTYEEMAAHARMCLKPSSTTTTAAADQQAEMKVVRLSRGNPQFVGDRPFWKVLAQDENGEWSRLVAEVYDESALPTAAPRCIHGHVTQVIWYCPTCERNYPATSGDEVIARVVVRDGQVVFEKPEASAVVHLLKTAEAELERLRAELTETQRARVGDAEIIGRWQCQAEKAEAELSALRATVKP